MKTALCIIDMQYRFASSAEAIVNKVISQVRLAQRKNSPIIVVEYVNPYTLEVDIEEEKTFSEIWDAIGEYPNVLSCKKEFDDGGDEVYNLLLDNQIKDVKLRLTGVNTDCCVYETGSTLIDYGIQLEVSASATNSCNDHKLGLFDFRARGAKIVA